MTSHMNSTDVYLRSPSWMQSLLCSAYGMHLIRRRYNRSYRMLEAAVCSRESWSPQQVRAFQSERLQQVVQHAAATVPYYRKVFAELGIAPEEIREVGDLRRLPLLDKGIVQQHHDAFVSERISSMKHSTVHTSGTTGAGLVFPFTIEAEQAQWAAWWRYRRRFGVDHGTWYAHFYGKSVVPLGQKRPPFWRVNWPGRQILFSAYHMTPEWLPSYVAELNRRRPPWIQGYPSLLAVLASFMLDRGLELEYTPRFVAVGAETLLPQQKAIIEDALGAPCRQHYGMTEGVANISECPCGNLHVDEDYAVVEFLPAGDGVYEVVGTSLTNDAFPLIRYRAGDMVELDDTEPKCPCGRSGRLVRSIDGRIEDYVVTPDGRRIGRCDHIFKDMVNVKECQIYQEDPGTVVFRVVRGSRYTETDARKLLSEARARLGTEIHIQVDYVDAVERTARGKLRFVVSRIPGARIEAATPVNNV